MAITLSTAARNAACDATVDLVDAGTTNAAGKLILMDASDTEMATLTFSNPAFGAASSGVATANAITADSSATGSATEPLALFKVVDRDETEVFRGTITVTGGGGDITFASLTVGAGDRVSITSFTYTEPATES